MTDQLILEKWSFTASASGYAMIVPDGCRDVILSTPVGSAPLVIVTDLDNFSREVVVRQGDAFIGYRLNPGVRVRDNLPAALGCDFSRFDDLAAVQGALVDCARTKEALAALKDAHGTADAARELGVSIRTLQRLVATSTGRCPTWWRRLARVRKVAAKLTSCEARQARLSEIAIDAGFADQAHMTRELRDWFAITPGELQRGGLIAESIRACGYE